MIITKEHYLQDKSRTEFLNKAFANGISNIKEYLDLNEKLNENEENTLVLPMGDTFNDIKRLLERGQFFEGKSTLFLMEASRCHDNAINYYLWYKDNEPDVKVEIVTGYALNKDGLWRSHTLILVEDEKIIETTETRLKYFGVILKENFKDQDFPNAKNEIESFIVN